MYTFMEMCNSKMIKRKKGNDCDDYAKELLSQIIALSNACDRPS